MSAIKEQMRSLVSSALQTRNRRNFLTGLKNGALLLDVGCGNDSPYLFKTIRPDIGYVGLDVGDYQNDHSPTEYADEYVVVRPEDFTAAIVKRESMFDAVVSSHNLEHCADPDGVVTAMSRALRPGGRIFLAFPSAASIHMPSRGGTLNFYDDTTHVKPPDFMRVLRLLEDEGVVVNFAAERFRPLAWVLFGVAVEPISRLRNTVMRGTWALYGFETVIWGTRALCVK